MKQTIWLITFLLLASLPLAAQRNEIRSPRIRSLQVVAGSRWRDMPIITLNSGEVVNISFDDLTHETHRYIYKVEHCEADWTVSEEVFESDFVEGFADGDPIDDQTESVNTNVLYTHYRFQLPNSRCRLKLSGNYRVTVYDENNGGGVMLVACFMVSEASMGVSLGYTTNTDLDINGRYQQVEMQLNYGRHTVTDWQREVKTVVLQNGRWDNAVWNARPAYIRGDGLEWSHCRDLIFNSGNVYRKFEMLDVNHTTMGMESVDWDGTAYHAYIWPDEPRPNYVYDESAGGAFFIRNSDNTEIDYTCEYLNVHFLLRSPRLQGRVYINGQWTNDWLTPEYELQWSEKQKGYELVLPLKQGYYSYQYLWQQPDGKVSPVPSEGNFYQTLNEYQALVYYRGIGERTDRLVGVGSTGGE